MLRNYYTYNTNIQTIPRRSWGGSTENELDTIQTNLMNIMLVYWYSITAVQQHFNNIFGCYLNVRRSVFTKASIQHFNNNKKHHISTLTMPVGSREGWLSKRPRRHLIWNIYTNILFTYQLAANLKVAPPHTPSIFFSPSIHNDTL